MKTNAFVNNVVTAIDIGTTKISVIIGHKLSDGYVEILAIGHAPCEGLKKGVVVDIVKTVISMRAAISEAELMSGLKIEFATIGISGSHIQSKNAYGAVAIERNEVKNSDIERAIETARAITLPEGQQILHVLPQTYAIDGNRVTDPIGMHGVRLEVQIHIITGSVSCVANIIKCCEISGIKVQDLVLEQLASAQAVLNEDEKELGVAMLDIGGGTADFAIYQQGTIRHTMVVAIAGNHFTNDLSIGLKIGLKDAEKIKHEYGSVIFDEKINENFIEIETVCKQQKSKIYLSEIVNILQMRARELLSIVHEDVVARKMQDFMIAGIVLTGGGSLLSGMKECAQEIFDMPVRIGSPTITYGQPEILRSPIHATGYGLLLKSINNLSQSQFSKNNEKGVALILLKMKSWIIDLF